jgi:hypothetical protein
METKDKPIFACSPNTEYTIQTITRRGWEDCCEPCSVMSEIAVELGMLRDQWEKDGSHRTIGAFDEYHRIIDQDGAVYREFTRTVDGLRFRGWAEQPPHGI